MRRWTMARIDFQRINQAALAAGLENLLPRWLPGWVISGEFTARNPRRVDRRAGSFRINCRSGRWCDFACGAKGGDVVSYVAYVTNCSQVEAVRRLAEALGIPAEA